MYEAYWKLREKPFECGVDPRTYYPAEAHQGTLLKLRYAIENQRGAALLCGGFGTGKTLLVRLLAKLALACVVLLGLAWGGSQWLLQDWATEPFWPKCASLFLVIGVAAAGFVACANALGITEVHEIVAAVRRRLRRRT